MTIRLADVWYRYPGSSKWVLKSINCVFEEGKIYVVIGPNASGKTTLLKVSSLIYRPVRGRVLVYGKNFWSLGKHEKLVLRRKIVYVHEKPILLKGSVLYNISFGLILRGLGKEEAYSRAEDVVGKLGLKHLLDKDTNELSAGEAQIVSILRAVILEPSMLFLDEPLSHIDVEKRVLVINIIKELKKKRVGVVIATHDMYLVDILADEVLVLNQGVLSKYHSR